MKKSLIFGILTIASFALFMILFLVGDSFGEGTTAYDTLVGISAVFMFACPVFFILFIVYFISGKRKMLATQNPENIINKQKALSELELKHRQAMLEMEREHNEKSQFRACGQCNARTPVADTFCSACGAAAKKN